MSFLGSVKDFFLPSEEVSAARRKDVFGTESKAVAGAVIIGSAAALIAAPVVIAKAGGGGAVLRSAGTKLVSSSNSTKLGLAVAAPIVAGAVLDEPKRVTRTAGGIANIEGNLFQVGKDPSLKNVKDVFLENPVIASGIAIAGAFALGSGVSRTISTALNTSAIRENTRTASENIIGFLPSPSGALPDTAMSNQYLPQGGASEGPLTPETQVLGKEVRSSAVRERRRARIRAERPVRVYNRVNILNQQVS